MRDDIWIEDDEPRRTPRSIVGIVAIAAVPWLIVAGMVLLPDGDDPPSQDPGDAQAEPSAGGDHDEVAGEDERDGKVAGEDGGEGASPNDLPGGETTEDTQPGSDDPDGAATEAPDAAVEGDAPSHSGAAGSGPDVSALDAAALDRLLAATATVVARAWATGVDPHLDIPGVPPANGARYAEHVAVESIERWGPEFAVVTLIAVVLEDLEDGLGAELRRMAVPLSIEEGIPRLAGEPWWLAPPQIEAADVPRELVPSPEVEAEADAALRDAGYREVEVTAVHRTAGWPWVVEVAAVAPGGEPVAGELWLRLDNDRFVLAGEAGVDAEGGA